jgi:hypothetical protein
MPLLLASLLAGCSNAAVPSAATPTAPGTSATPSSAPTTKPDLDGIFLSDVKTDAPDVDDVTLVRVAHVVCERMHEDPTPDVETWRRQVKELTINGFTARQAGAMIGSATAVYCPDVSNLAP